MFVKGFRSDTHEFDDDDDAADAVKCAENFHRTDSPFFGSIVIEQHRERGKETDNEMICVAFRASTMTEGINLFSLD